MAATDARGTGRGRDADAPGEIPAAGWKDVAWRVWKEVRDDRLTSVAAAITYYALLAIFPGIAALVSLYALIADPSTIRDHLVGLSGLLPGGAMEVIGGQVARIASTSGGALSLGAIAGLGVALWSANAGTKAVFEGLNVAFDEEEERGFVALTLTTLAFTAGLILFVLVAVAAIVALPVAADTVGLGGVAGAAMSWLRWPLLFALLVAVLAVLYRYGPCRERAEWRWVTPGSVVAAALWLAVSAGFSWYVGNFGSYNATYGSLGAVIGFMTWIWLSSLVVLLGAEVNAEIEHQTARDTTDGAPQPMGARGAEMADEVGESAPD